MADKAMKITAAMRAEHTKEVSHLKNVYSREHEAMAVDIGQRDAVINVLREEEAKHYLDRNSPEKQPFSPMVSPVVSAALAPIPSQAQLANNKVQSRAQVIRSEQVEISAPSTEAEEESNRLPHDHHHRSSHSTLATEKEENKSRHHHHRTHHHHHRHRSHHHHHDQNQDEEI